MKEIVRTGIEWDVNSILNDMIIGWNMGNSLEANSETIMNINIDEYETLWGNPKITKEMFEKVIQAGFNVIRIPITWWGKVDTENDYKIFPEWMARVQEVVDYAFSLGVYVIINIHHEDEWLYLGDSNVETKAVVIIEKLWKQIAEGFKTYGSRLIFETMNEVRFIGTSYEWNAGTTEGRAMINKFNEIAVRTIRGTGSNNLYRLVLIKTIGARYNPEVIDDIIIPNNDARVALAVHFYVPYFFCMCGDRDVCWGDEKDKKEMSDMLEKMSEAAKRRNVRLLITEFGTIDKDNEAERAKYCRYLMKETKKRGIKCLIWDNNIADKDNYPEFTYSIFNREELIWRTPLIVESLFEGLRDA